MLPAPPAGGPRPGEVSAQGLGSLQHLHLPGVRSSEEQPGAAPRAAGAAAVPPPRAIPGGAGGTKQLPARFAQCGEEKDGASLGSRPPGRWKTQGGRLLRCLHPLSVRPSARPPVHPFGAWLLAPAGPRGGFCQEAGEVLIVLCVALNYFPIPTGT